MKTLIYIFLCILIFIAGAVTGNYLVDRYTSRFFVDQESTPPPAPTFFQGGPGAADTSATGQALWQPSGEVIEVKNGESIQVAVGKAEPGALIKVFPGKYKETVYVDKDNIALQGVILEGAWPVLDGEKELNDAFLYSGNNILIENFKIINYKGNGVMGQAGNNFVIRNNWIADAGVYGIFPEFGKNGLVSHNILSGIEDAAIYVGMCDNVDVLNNEVFENVAGIEIENSRHCLVENNYAHDNTGGILAFITPGLPIKTAYDIIIRNNFVLNNNHENFGAKGSIVANIPPGTGVLIMAADQVIVENNIIAGNDNSGITISDLSFAADVSKDPDSEPNPDNLILLDNFMFNNGNNPVGIMKDFLMTKFEKIGPDIMAVGGGTGSCIRDKSRYRTEGLDNWGVCELPSTAHIASYMLAEPVKPRTIPPEEKGKQAYYGICAGCHAYDVRMIGPPTMVIQALYLNNPKGIADYIAQPERKRDDYPEMPPQNYLSEETRMAVAEFMLGLEK